MTIPELSTAMATNQVQTAVSTAVLGQQLDAMETQGESVVNMMNRSMLETSVNPNIGANIDLTL